LDSAGEAATPSTSPNNTKRAITRQFRSMSSHPVYVGSSRHRCAFFEYAGAFVCSVSIGPFTSKIKRYRCLSPCPDDRRRGRRRQTPHPRSSRNRRSGHAADVSEIGPVEQLYVPARFRHNDLDAREVVAILRIGHVLDAEVDGVQQPERLEIALQ